MEEIDYARAKPVAEDSNADAINIDGWLFNLFSYCSHVNMSTSQVLFVDVKEEYIYSFSTQMDVILRCVKIWKQMLWILRLPPGV